MKGVTLDNGPTKNYLSSAAPLSSAEFQRLSASVIVPVPSQRSCQPVYISAG